jgi:hypothetical protein
MKGIKIENSFFNGIVLVIWLNIFLELNKRVIEKS